MSSTSTIIDTNTIIPMLTITINTLGLIRIPTIDTPTRPWMSTTEAADLMTTMKRTAKAD